MITISLCMIVKNEEDVLARCLGVALHDIVDEIIIVDTGSEDSTKEIAKRYTKHIYDFPWIDDFSAARNFSFSKATMEYCMWLDADDILLEPDRIDLLKLKQSLTPAPDMVMMKYHTSFDENGEPTFSYYRERLIRNRAGYQWEGAIHEVIAPSGVVLHSEIAVTHRKTHPSDPDRNLRIFEKLLAKGIPLEPRQQFYYARELYYHERYKDAIQVLEHFLDEGKGWMENQIDACLHLSYCYKKERKPKQALQALFHSFAFDIPRAEVCCEIGHSFFHEEKYLLATFWYERALRCKRNDKSGGFVSPDCYDYIPYMQLCVCHDRLGNATLAEIYNEQAGKYKPSSSAYLSNKEYFNQKHK